VSIAAPHFLLPISTAFIDGHQWADECHTYQKADSPQQEADLYVAYAQQVLAFNKIMTSASIYASAISPLPPALAPRPPPPATLRCNALRPPHPLTLLINRDPYGHSHVRRLKSRMLRMNVMGE